MGGGGERSGSSAGAQERERRRRERRRRERRHRPGRDGACRHADMPPRTCEPGHASHTERWRRWRRDGEGGAAWGVRSRRRRVVPARARQRLHGPDVEQPVRERLIVVFQARAQLVAEQLHVLVRDRVRHCSVATTCLAAERAGGGEEGGWVVREGEREGRGCGDPRPILSWRCRFAAAVRNG